MPSIRENWLQVRNRLEKACARTGRSPDSVQLIAVTKTVPVERIREALDAGLTHLGENYIQEAQRKIEALGRGTWHFIGHLQRNKARAVVRVAHQIHSVDSVRLLEAIDRLAAEEQRHPGVYLELDFTAAEQRTGLDPAEVEQEVVAGPRPSL